MSKRQSKTPLIYALEPRLLFDGDLGPDVASAIVYRDGNATDAAPAVAPENQRETQRENISFEFHSTRSAIVFIDGGVEDPQTLADAAADVLPDDAQIHILDGDSNGFAQINDILQNHDRVDEIHIFGHGTAGEARLGTASLSLETLTTHSDTMAVLKDTLTEDGDILLYGCNIAAGDNGQTFIEELAELTAADIAASDDITGAGGDWELEASTGPIEANAIEAWDYQYSLTPDGVASMNANVVERTHSNLNVKARPDISNSDKNNNRGFYDYDNSERFVIALEKSNITATETLYFDFGVSVGQGGSYNVSSGQRVASYLVALNNDVGRRDSGNAQIVFENEILGYYVDKYNTLGSGTMRAFDASEEGSFQGQGDGDTDVTEISNSYFANSSWTYPTTSQINKRDSEGYFQRAFGTGSSPGADYIWTSNNTTLNFAAKNGNTSGTGDFIRVITKWQSPPTVTSATDVSGSATELTDGHANENTATLSDTGSFTIADSNGDTVSVSRAFSSTTHSSNAAFGDLTADIANNTTTDGTGQINWTYSVDDSDLEALDAGESYVETWTITVSDGSANVTQNVTVTINGAADSTNDAPTVSTAAVDPSIDEAADASAQALNESGTITFADAEDTNLTITGAASATVTAGSGVSVPSDLQTALAAAFSVTDNDDNTAGWTLNATDLDLDFLTAGQTITLAYVATATDDNGASVTDTITATITGTNDAPTVSTAAVDPSIDEAADASAQALNESGTITFADAEDTNLTITGAASATVTAGSGVSVPSDLQTALAAAFSVTDNDDNTAGWTLNATDLDLDFLTAGQTITLAYVATATDDNGASVTDTITATITGTNDAPTVSTAAVDPSIDEAADASAQALNESGTITFADAEDTNLTITGAASATVTAGSGVSVPSDLQTALAAAFSVTDNDDNTAGWTLNATDLDLDFLTAGQTITLAYVATATDDNGASVTDTITATITGTNDAPTVSTAAVDPSIDEAADASAQALNESGTITFADAEDTNLTITGAASATVTAGSGVSVPSDLQTALAAAFSVTDNDDNTAGWTLNATDLDLDFLTAGQTITLAYVATATDDNGASVTDTITATITGTNDAPVAADIIASVLEGSTIQSGASRVDLIGPTGHLYDSNYVSRDDGVGSYQIGYETTAPMDLAFSPDGNKFYVLAYKDMPGNIDKRVVTYDLQSPWDVSARTFNSAKVYDLPADPTSISNNTAPNDKLMTSGMAFGEAGTKMFVSQYNQLGGTLYSFDLSTAYDVSTASPTASPDTSITIPDTSGENRYLEPFDGRFDLGFSEDGLSMFTLEQHKGSGAGMLRQLAKYNLSTAWDISTADMNNRTTHVFSTTDDTEVEAGFVFGGSGTKLFVIDVGNLDTNTGSAIREYNLATPYDISNMTEVRVTSLDGEWFAKHLYSIELSADETKIYLTGHGGGSTGAYIYEFDIYEDPALSNDTDADGDALTLTFVASDAVASGTTYANGTDIDGQYGALTIGANGSYRYVSNESAQDALDAGDKVTDSFAYTVSDGSATSTANLVVTVIGVNDTPTAANNTVTINEDFTKTFAASDFNFADVDASSSLSSIKITSLPATGALTLNGTAVSQNQTIAASQIANLVFTPVANGNGDPYTTFQFKVNDGTVDSASAYTMTVDVTPNNDAPTVSTAAVDPSIDEAADASAQALNESGTITFADAEDTNLTITGAASATVTAGSGVSVPSDLQTALAAAFSVTDNDDNTAGWTLNATDLDLDFLTAGQTITLAYVATATDDNGASVTDTITATITGTNDAPTVSTAAVDPSIDEAADASAQALNESGTITFADAEDTNLTITGAASATVTAGSGVSVPSDLQTALAAAFSVTDNDDNTAGWTLNATDLDLDFLTAGQTITLAYVATATDDNGASVTDTITATITGTNDAPTVSTAAVDPSIDEAADASAQALNESGTITFADAEDTNLTITGAASATVTAGSGVSVPSDLQTALAAAFSVTDNDDNTAGWTLNATDLDLDFLTAGQTITLAYVATATDDNGASVTDTITATITGTNDAPTVSTAAVDPSIDEAADASAQALNESGTITFADAEDTNLTITGAASATVTAGSGVSVPSDLQTALAAAFSVTDNDDNTAGWTLNATDLDLDFLTAGQTITLAYVATATDDNGASVTDTITATITGTNDAPTVSTAAVDPSIDEAADASAQALNESGTITFADAEDTNLTITGAASATVTAGSGVSVPSDLQTALAAAFSVTDNDDNTAGWTLNATDLDLDFLTAGQTITLAYVATATDDNGASVTDTITATITGTNDAPTVSTAAVDPSIDEAADASAQALNESGTITFADAEDTNLTITGAASATVTAGSGVSVPSDLQTALAAAFSVTDNDDNTAGWTLNATDLDLDFLTAGQTITLAYVATATDDNGASVTDTITATITGTNDAPTVSTAAVDPSIDEAADASAQALNESGTITFADAEDTNLTITGAASATVTAGSGVSVPSDLQTALAAAFSVTDNDDNTAGWTLNATDLDLDFLTAGQTITLAYVATATDDNGASVTDTITATITGTNDAPTVSTAAVDPSIDEAADASAQALNESGTITFADAEDTNLTITGAASATVTAGSGVSVPSDLQTALAAAFSVTDNDDNTAGWTLNATDLDLDFLTAGQTITLAYVATATDDNGASVTDTITATITGTNDAPTVSTAAVDPSIDEAADASAQALNESGTITFADAEDTNLTITGAASATVTAGSGVSVPSDLQTALAAAFSVTDNDDNTAGWTLNATDLDLDFLTAGQTITLAYVATATDDNGASVTDTITATITGTNDAPTVSTAAVDPSIDEAADASAQALNESGTITFADAEDTNLTITGAASATVTAGSGVSVPSDLQTALAAAFSVTDNDDNTAGWTLNATDLDLDFLTAGQTITLAYVATATDDNGASVTDTITATITGTNDAPTVSTAAVDPSIDEAADASAQALNESGTITFADAEDTNLTITGAASATVTAGSGVSVPSDLQTALAAAFSVTDNDDNTAGWTLNATDLDLDFLTAGQTITLAYVATATDDNGASVTDTITATITGTNDAPTVSTAAVDPSIDEAADASAQALNESGTITFADAEDTNLTITGAASATVTAGSGVSVPSDLQTALAAAFSVTDNDDNTAGWTLNATDLDLDFLTAGQTITLEYAVTAEDDDGETVTDNVTVTINGTSDAPIAIGDTGNVEVGTEFSGNVLTTSMGGEDLELDAGDSFQVDRLTGFGTAQVISNSPGSSATAVGKYGTITLSEDGSVTYNADQAAAIALASGQPSVSETFNYRIADTDGETGTSTITFTISGVNDAPAVSDDNGTPDDASDDIANAATVSTVEDTPHTFGADDFNFTDIDTDDTLASVTITSLPDKGTLTLNGAEVTLDTPIALAYLGDLEYTPLDDENGAGYASFAYTASDGELDSPAATMTINVTPDNDAPVVSAITDSKTEDAASFDTDLLSGQTDPDGDTLSVSGTPSITAVDGNNESYTLPDGTASVNNGTLSVDPTKLNGLGAGESVDITVTYNVSDGTTTTQNTATITVTGVNDAPVVSAITDSKTEDAASFDTDLLSGQTDPDGDTLSVSGTPSITAVDGNNESYTLPDGTASVNNGTLSVDPTKLNGLGAGESVDITVTYNVSDGTTTTQNTATITVTGVNDAPTANNDTADVIVGFAFSGNVINSTMNGEDTDSDNSDILSITGFASADGVSGTVDDQNGLSGRYGTLALNSDGSLTYNADLQTALDLTSENAAVTDNFTYTVSDGNGGTGTATLSFSIKAPEPGDGPPLVSPINISVTENDEAFSANLLAGQSDPNGDNLSIYGRPIITAIDSDGNEYPWSETAISVSDNILSIEPGMVGELDDGESVDFIVTYNVSDGNQSVQNTATITVAGVNDAPIVTATYEVTTEDNEPLSIDLMAKQLDPDGDDKSISGTPTITAVDGNNQSFTLPDGTASVNNGTLSVDPTKLNSLGAGESVDITVTYDVSDGTTTTQNTATVTVTGVNDAPIVRAITGSKTEDAASFDTDLLSGQTDPDGDMLSVSGTPTITAVDGNNQSYTLPDGTASVNNGTLSVDPTKLNSLGAGESVDITVTYDVSDGTTTTQNTATITVTGVNDAPTANENAITIAEDPTHTFSADEFNFTDIDGDVLNSIDVKSLPAKGELTLSGSAVKQNQTIFASQISDLVYTPILNDVGKDYSSFTFTVNDGETDSASTYTMNIHVTGQNDPPEVVPIIDARTEDDAAFTKNLTLGQTDPDDDNLSVTDSQIKAIFANGDAVTLPTGTVSLDGNYLTINPNLLNAMPQGESVVITVTYDISDGELTATNTATITISGRNDAPVSFGKNIELNGEAPISLTREDFAFNDIDGDDLDKVTIETTPTNGLLYLNGMEVQGGDGIPAESLIDLVYKPGVGASGSNYDAFTFSVNDGQDKSLIHALTIGVNAAPTAEDDIVSSPEDTSFFGQMKATDLDSAKLTYRITQEPEHGTVTVVDNGPDYIYLPDPHYYGPDSFIFEASDGTLTDAGEVDIDVTPENDRPIQRYEIKDVSLLEGQKAKIFITQAFAEIDALDPTLSGFNNAIEKLFKDGRFGDDDQLSDLPVSGQLTYSATGLPDGLELNSSNRIGGKSNELGTFPIVVRATDGEGEYREISFKLTVSNPVINSFPERKIDIPLESLVDIVQEEIPELNDHNLPPVLKVKPKRDGIIPKHSTDANVTSPLTTFDNNSLSDENSLTQGHWLNTRVSSQQDLSGNIRVVAMDVKDAEISVQIADQAVDAAERFEGEMSDGTRLPDWITVDAATGLTKAEPPQGAGPIEMRVVAEDNAGNTRSIDIILETSLLKNNIESVETFERTPREIKREARQAAREARQEERQKEREARQNDRTVASSAKQLTRSRNNVEALIDGRVVFTDEQAALGDGGIRLLSMASEDALLKIQIDDIQRADETRYEIRMTDGSITPGWVRINPLTGELTIDAPEDTDILDLQLIAIQGDLQRSIQLQLTPKELLQSRPDDVEKATKAIQEETLNQDGIETVEQPVELSPDILKGNESGHFVPLDAQIEDALAENQYGRDIQYALQDNT